MKISPDCPESTEDEPLQDSDNAEPELFEMISARDPNKIDSNDELLSDLTMKGAWRKMTSRRRRGVERAVTTEDGVDGTTPIEERHSSSSTNNRHWFTQKSNDYVMSMPWRNHDRSQVQALLFWRTVSVLITAVAVLVGLIQLPNLDVVYLLSNESQTCTHFDDDDTFMPDCMQRRNKILFSLLTFVVASMAVIAMVFVRFWLDVTLRVKFVSGFGDIDQQTFERRFNSRDTMGPVPDRAETA